MILLNRINIYVVLSLMMFSSLTIHAQISREEFNDELLKVKDETSATKLIEKHSLKGFITEISEARDTNELSDELFKLKLREPYYYYLGNDEYCAYPLNTGKKIFYRVNYIYFPSNIYSRKKIDSIRPLIINRIKNGESFSDLAWQYSYGGGVDHGDLYWFYDGMMVKGFQDAVENHKKGDLYVLDLPKENWSYIVQNAYSPKRFETLTYLKIENPPGNTDIQLYTLSPRWNIGDVRTVSYVSESVVTKGGKEVSFNKVINEYKIHVLDSIDGYTLTLRGSDKGYLFDYSNMVKIVDSLTPSFKDILRKVEKEISDLEFKVKIDKNLFNEVILLNQDVISNKLIEISFMIFSEMVKQNEYSEVETEQMKNKLNSTIYALMPKMQESINKLFKSFFDPHTVEFPLNSSYSTELEIESGKILSSYGKSSFPSNFTVSSEVLDSGKILINTVTIIDKKYLLEFLKNGRPSLKDLIESDITSSFKEEVYFDTNTGWILSRKTDQTVFVKDSKVNNSLFVEFR